MVVFTIAILNKQNIEIVNNIFEKARLNTFQFKRWLCNTNRSPKHDNKINIKRSLIVSGRNAFVEQDGG